MNQMTLREILEHPIAAQLTLAAIMAAYFHHRSPEEQQRIVEGRRDDGQPEQD